MLETIIEFSAITPGVALALGVMVLCLIGSALVSGSEVAFFSLKPGDIQLLQEADHPRNELVIFLLNRPKTLLATILIANNFINIGIVLLSSFVVSQTMDFKTELTGFLIQVVAITFLILLFGEVIPKVYATSRALQLARFISPFISRLMSVTKPLSKVLISTTGLIEKRLGRREANISVDDLGHALELTYNDETTDNEEQRILKGIVEFSNKTTTQIMTPRVEVVALDVTASYPEVKQTILDAGYSRMPVYKDSFDQIEGILYIKDLLHDLHKKDHVNWQKWIRPAYFVPENKNIADLLHEFQQRKIHLAIVVDEYGGASGIISLEDILEEIVGEISDEFDDEEIVYSKLDDQNYVFEGKTPLVDMYKILNIEGEDFEKQRGDSGTIAGFLLEITSRIPRKDEEVQFGNYTFTIEAADRRKIKRVKVTLQE